MPTPPVTEICTRIAEIVQADMVAAGLTVSELATRAGVPRSTLARKLASGLFRAGELGKVAEVLGRRPSQWFKIAEQQGTV